MATKKVTITLDETLVEALTTAAHEDGVPVSRVVAGTMKRELRRRAGMDVVREWEAEHGTFTHDELAAARTELAEAEATHLSRTKKNPAT